MLETLHIYYTNDFHSNFSQWPKVSGYLKKQEMLRTRQGRDCWIADIGDHMDRVASISEATKGKANVALMNEAGYDVATIGNNEGITLSHNDLHQLYEEAQFSVICSNLDDRFGNNPQWLKHEATLVSKQGTRLGIMALTAAFAPFYGPLGWKIEDPFQVLSEKVRQMKQEHDLVILLSHLGLSDDEEIARRFPEIDVIIGAHTHHLLKNGKEENGVLLTAAGKGSLYVGEVILEWDTDKRQLIQKAAFAHDVTTAAGSKETEKRIDALQRKADAVLNKTVVKLQEPLKVDWFETTPIIRQLADHLKEWTKADCAMINAGVLLESFPAGPVTEGDIHRICPHPINPCTVAVSGEQLIEILRASQTEALIHYPLKGFGFRGKVIGKMVFSGLAWPVKKDSRSTMDGRTINTDRKYVLATADTFTFGRLFPEIARAEQKTYFLPEFLRDILRETLIAHYG